MLNKVGVRATFLAMCTMLSGGAFALADAPKIVNIPAGDLPSALLQLARQSGADLVYRPEQVYGLKTQGALGTLTTEQAVIKLLYGTKLHLQLDSSGAMLILPQSGDSASHSNGSSAPPAASATGMSGSSPEGTKIGAETFLMAQNDTAPTGAQVGRAQTPQPTTQSTEQLAEVIVTAQKRSERLEDVPVAITVVDADSMVQKRELTLQDYYASVPGLSIVDQGTGGRVMITMRGLSTGAYGNSTVGITVDDVPFGASDAAVINGAQYVPQFDPADLQRIEFLKGPQGTLYGASSLGGVVRYVTAAPNLASPNGDVEVDGSLIPGGGNGYGLRGSMNIPLISDTLGTRISVFDRRDPGYIDDPAQGTHNLNSTDNYGGHAALLFQASQNVSLTLSALLQKTEGQDSTIDTNYHYQPISGDLNQSRLPGTGGYNYEDQLYSATLNFHWDIFDLTSITGYGIVDDYEPVDESGPDGGLAQSFFGVPGSGIPFIFDSKKLSQEVRLSSPTGSRFEWQLGGFFTDENDAPNNFSLDANNPGTGAVVGVVDDGSFSVRYREYAGFANLTYHFTDRFNVQLGGREAHNWQTYNQDFAGPLIGPITDNLTTRTSDSSFTYLVSPQYRLSEALMTYARVASGYQPGGPNTPFVPNTPVPSAFGPSTTVNYELGLKSRLMDRRLSIDVDVFYITWSRIQLAGVYAPDEAGYTFNGGRAKSQGVELATEFKPVEGLTISAATTYTDAELTSNAGNSFPGVAGDPLPFSSKFSASISAEERFRVSSSVDGFLGADAAYVGKRYEGFPGGPGEPQPSIPSYAYGNLQMGIVTNGYTVSAFVKNVTNERGILSSNQFTSFTPTTGIWHTAITTPRTVGISVSKAF